MEAAMIPSERFPCRRRFLKTSAALAAGFSGLPLLAQPPDSPESDTIVGPRKGYSLDYYVNILHETREKTLAEFRKRDDKWLMAVDKDWGWGPTNNYCKWFHVTEHEANHNGQIKFLKSRLPGAKSAS